MLTWSVFDGVRPRRSLVTRSRLLLQVGVGHQLDRCSLRLHMTKSIPGRKTGALRLAGMHVSDSSPKSNKSGESTRENSCAGFRVCIFKRKDISMSTGTVKWFNIQKGFGFIQPDGGGKDVFVHISAVERAGMNSLNEGQKITYEVQQERGKSAAVNLKA